MRNRMYGGVRGRKTKVGRKLRRFPPTRLGTGEVNFTSLGISGRQRRGKRLCCTRFSDIRLPFPL